MPAASGKSRTPRVHLVDHGTGNLTSLQRALALGGAEVSRSGAARDLDGADALVLPGVGAFPNAIDSLRRLGLIEAIRDWHASGRLLLGVCLGMQLLFESSTEAAGADGLGLIEGEVRIMDAMGGRLPHIGWTGVDWKSDHPIRQGLANPTALYHVHSYVCQPNDPSTVLATATHGETFATAVASGNTIGLQFHPEKSSTEGLRMIANFVGLAAARIGA